uniref:Soluble scavenger receptor cysteine-rich domain-containing protein SSC5D n=1 Tax=Pelodiscus sinensis TaxID=13735 RepID=K7FSL6_PELSI
HCNNGRDASVGCSDSEIPLRLANGSSRCAGRVEVLHDQQWGTVCDDDWDLTDAGVVCRQLGCGTVLSAPGAAQFGQGSERIWLDDINCKGTEAALSECTARPWGDNNCNHGEDASAVCSDCRGHKEPGRFAGSGANSLVWVEVLHDQQWGTVCDDDWDLTDAGVVCRQLGCGTVLSAPGAAQFGQGSERIWLDDINCKGTEAALSECTARPWGDNNCNHGEDASAVCSAEIPLRLVNGPSHCAGRVEVLHDQQWGTVCDDDWDLTDAGVVCRQLGCGTVLSAPGVAQFGQGSGRIWLDDVNCTGTEAALSECTARPWGDSNCNHGEDASAVCSALGLSFVDNNAGQAPLPPTQPLLVPTNSTPPAEIPLRLVNGPSHCAGRVEVLHDQQWGTVCDDDWDLTDAGVVCRQLGCGTVLSAPGVAQFGQGSGRIWLDDVNCTGTEAALSECTARPWGDSNCNHGEDASAVCSVLLTLRFTGKGAGGATVGSAQADGAWGHHGKAWRERKEKEIYCRIQLGAETGPIGPGSLDQTRSAPGWNNQTSCPLPLSCLYRPVSHPLAVAVIKHSTVLVLTGEIPLRLANGSSRCAGRVEVLHGQQWGTVCDDDWDLTDAGVMCREL